MARRSILSPVRAERPSLVVANLEAEMERPEQATATRPSRVAKIHIGGYFEPNDATIIAFQKLRVDLRRSQQDMLLEALHDFVAKHEAASAFR